MNFHTSWKPRKRHAISFPPQGIGGPTSTIATILSGSMTGGTWTLPVGAGTYSEGTDMAITWVATSTKAQVIMAGGQFTTNSAGFSAAPSIYRTAGTVPAQGTTVGADVAIVSSNFNQVSTTNGVIPTLSFVDTGRTIGATVKYYGGVGIGANTSFTISNWTLSLQAVA